MRWGGIWCKGVGAKYVKPLQDKSWAVGNCIECVRYLGLVLNTYHKGSLW